MKKIVTTQKELIEESIARYAAQPEFDYRLATELMGWQLMPDGFYDTDMNFKALPNWSPTTDANAAIEVMRSEQWTTKYPTAVVIFRASPKHGYIVASEDDNGLTELARDSRMPMAVSIAAIRLLGPLGVRKSN